MLHLTSHLIHTHSPHLTSVQLKSYMSTLAQISHPSSIPLSSLLDTLLWYSRGTSNLTWETLYSLCVLSNQLYFLYSYLRNWCFIPWPRSPSTSLTLFLHTSTPQISSSPHWIYPNFPFCTISTSLKNWSLHSCPSAQYLAHPSVIAFLTLYNYWLWLLYIKSL